MGKIPLSPFFLEVWKDGISRFVRREAGRFVKWITDYSQKGELWKDGILYDVARDKRGRFITWKRAPVLEAAEEEEYFPEEEEPAELFRITVALRGVKHGDYFNVVAHYYGLAERDAEAQVPELMKRVLKEMYKVSGYHDSAVDDFRISDVARIPYDEHLVGEIELEEEWEL
jgi:hypothetical protein